MSGILTGARRTGRLKKSWRRTIQQEHEDLRMTWNQVKLTTQNWVDGKLLWRSYALVRTPEVTPRKVGWGFAAHFPKPLPHL